MKLIHEANVDEVVDAALQMHSTSLLQRLGFILDLSGWPLSPGARTKLKSAIAPSARSVFGQANPKRGDIGYVAEWGLLVHASHSTLLADVPRFAERIVG